MGGPQECVEKKLQSEESNEFSMGPFLEKNFAKAHSIMVNVFFISNKN